MTTIPAFLAIGFFVILTIPFVGVKYKGILVYFAIVVNAGLTGYLAIQALMGLPFEAIFQGSAVTGAIALRLDALSAWFILIINFIFITGGFYGFFYMKAYQNQSKNLSLHGIVFVLLYSALISLTVIQNGMVFLIAWEIMALTAFISVIFEHEKMATIKAGFNYLLQSHVAILFLMLGFMWAAYKTGSYDFQVLSNYTAGEKGAATVILFTTFFVGFALKAGFVPFHTWLPYAHPAAPAHISGIMSGVMIKIGIFGILRMMLVIKPDFAIIGYIILVVSVISGLYGVMLAIVQHNLKRLLAYHSIENIGIIGMGIGLGSIGLGTGNLVLATLGFAAALLHVWNHALFKSLLFFTAGNVYQATHTLNIEQLGGLIKKMPQTAFLFLIAAIAISGLPPFNGFISEFILYSGLYHWLLDARLLSLVAIVFAILGLVMIGGLAMLCFTKAFGVVFLGNARHTFKHEVHEVSFQQLIPLYLIAFFIVAIGFFPGFFLKLLIEPVSLLAGNRGVVGILETHTMQTMQQISWAAWGFIALISVIFIVRILVSRKRTVAVEPTWGCGYVKPTANMQYTASSFVRSYTKLFKPLLLSYKKEKNIQDIFPADGFFESHPYDKLEKWLYDTPIMEFKSFMSRFIFLQNGRLQFYILYGIIFIISIICIPIVYDMFIHLIGYFKQL
jgi:formate hydrogenlyase subunit 3/multisubunit Na+/H+ antiporter MnhD subunit